MRLFFKKKYCLNNKGVALIITMLIMTLLLFLAIYFLNFSTIEKRISQSQFEGMKSYYLAEAGVAEMIFKLKNDESYKSSFETNPAWEISFTRQSPFGASNESYTVEIKNTSRAHGEIISTGMVDLGNGKTSQRIIKTNAYRAMGEVSDIAEMAGYADGNIDISSSQVNFYNGSAQANINFTVNGISLVNVVNDLKAVGNFVKSWLSTVNVNGEIYASNYPNGPAGQVEMPAIDFDSADLNSFRNRANKIYTQAEFDSMMADNQNLTLNDPIIYISGDVDVKGAQNLIINGLLVVEKDFKIGDKLCRGARCGLSNLTINHISGQPSGILSKNKINFDSWAGNINVNGVVYANDQLNILSLPLGQDSNYVGGLIGRKLTITSTWQPVNITRDEEILNSTLNVSQFSPIITVEHWEEEY